MKNLIVSWKVVLPILLFTGLFLTIQFVVDGFVKDSISVGADVSCTFSSWSVHGESLRLHLNCDGKKAWTEKAEVILGYIAKPGPLKCSIMESGKANCNPL